jgi:hypothetical protein
VTARGSRAANCTQKGATAAIWRQRHKQVATIGPRDAREVVYFLLSCRREFVQRRLVQFNYDPMRTKSHLLSTPIPRHEQ